MRVKCKSCNRRQPKTSIIVEYQLLLVLLASIHQRWAKLLILVDFDVDIDNILEIDVEFDVWSDFDFGIEYCQANLQMLKLSTNLDMQLLNLEFES